VHSKCKSVFNELETRKEDSRLVREELEIADDCYLYHYVTGNVDSWLPDEPKPQPAVFGRPGLSVFVAGTSFPNFELVKHMEAFRVQMNWTQIGAVRFKAADIMNPQLFDFYLVHDPHAFVRESEIVEQGPNHGMIVCLKDSEARVKLVECCEALERPLPPR
jgi:hypothetical protein